MAFVMTRSHGGKARKGLAGRPAAGRSLGRPPAGQPFEAIMRQAGSELLADSLVAAGFAVMMLVLLAASARNAFFRHSFSFPAMVSQTRDDSNTQHYTNSQVFSKSKSSRKTSPAPESKNRGPKPRIGSPKSGFQRPRSSATCQDDEAVTSFYTQERGGELTTFAEMVSCDMVFPPNIECQVSPDGSRYKQLAWPVRGGETLQAKP